MTVLCTAYNEIKAVDSEAIVVSAGLAPTGRVTGNWGGHAGHNGLYQDEREFLKEFFDAGGGNCTDAIGYHPYGFSADYDVAPDVPDANPARNCTNGFCFRGTEKIYEIMVQRGMRPMDAIKAATSVAAEHMDRAGQVGAIEEGRFGDLVAVRGNPLDDVSVLQDIRVVIKGGLVFKLATSP